MPHSDSTCSHKQVLLTSCSWNIIARVACVESNNLLNSSRGRAFFVMSDLNCVRVTLWYDSQKNPNHQHITPVLTVANKTHKRI